MSQVQAIFFPFKPASAHLRKLWCCSSVLAAIAFLLLTGLALTASELRQQPASSLGVAAASASQQSVPVLALASPRVMDHTQQSILGQAAPAEPLAHSLADPEVIESPESAVPAVHMAIYDQCPVRTVRKMTMTVTAYCAGPCCCGKSADGITASGKSVRFNGGKLVAADTRVLPFGSIVSIPGYANDQPVSVQDRGGAIKGHRLDLLMPTHAQARLWGRRVMEVTIWEKVP